MDLGSLFGVDIVNHGDPQEAFEWKWPTTTTNESESEKSEESEKNSDKTVGEIEAGPTLRLHLADGSTGLMAQHVWQSAITMGEEIAMGKIDVKDKVVLELGAGAALPGIVSTKMNAKMVVISDYPEEEIVQNMIRNVKENFKEGSDAPGIVKGFKWGESVEELTNLLPEGESFDTILMADTLWLEDQHPFLLQSLRELTNLNKSKMKIYMTFMNHDDGKGIAQKFMTEAEKLGFKALVSQKIHWKKEEKHLGNIDEIDALSDCSDPDIYGPVHFRVLVDADEFVDDVSEK